MDTRVSTKALVFPEPIICQMPASQNSNSNTRRRGRGPGSESSRVGRGETQTAVGGRRGTRNRTRSQPFGSSSTLLPTHLVDVRFTVPGTPQRPGQNNRGEQEEDDEDQGDTNEDREEQRRLREEEIEALNSGDSLHISRCSRSLKEQR